MPLVVALVTFDLSVSVLRSVERTSGLDEEVRQYHKALQADSRPAFPVCQAAGGGLEALATQEALRILGAGVHSIGMLYIQKLKQSQQRI